MTRWTFLRHGQSVANAEAWIAGHTDSPLTERGRREARGAAEPLRDLPFERVLTSDLCRAHETARLAVPDHTPLVDAGLRERSMGEWEGRPRAELATLGLGDVVLSETGRPPGGESHQDLTLRALRTLAAYDDGTPTLVVAHGGLLRAVIGAVDGVDAVRATRIRFPNAGLQTRALPRGIWSSLLAARGQRHG